MHTSCLDVVMKQCPCFSTSNVSIAACWAISSLCWLLMSLACCVNMPCNSCEASCLTLRSTSFHSQALHDPQQGYAVPVYGDCVCETVLSRYFIVLCSCFLGSLYCWEIYADWLTESSEVNCSLHQAVRCCQNRILWAKFEQSLYGIIILGTTEWVW